MEELTSMEVENAESPFSTNRQCCVSCALQWAPGEERGNTSWRLMMTHFPFVFSSILSLSLSPSLFLSLSLSLSISLSLLQVIREFILPSEQEGFIYRMRDIINRAEALMRREPIGFLQGEGSRLSYLNGAGTLSGSQVSDSEI